ncbi:MAG: hypothetical protein ACI9D5_000693 [Candidatus Endobugula sp.]|jgi:uncharacterized protein (DUF58 family)
MNSPQGSGLNNTGFQSYFSRYYQRWLERRIPPNAQQILQRKNIFILPSKAGIAFLATITLLWLLGTNYQNNLVVVLSFLLLSLLHTGILYSYSNFSGLSIAVNPVADCFAGDTAKVNGLLKSHRQRNHHTITLGWSPLATVSVDIAAQQSTAVTLLLEAPQRGWYRADRLTIASVYPLGLIRTWARLDMDVEFLVYPQPIVTPLPAASLVRVENADNETLVEPLSSLALADDVSHLREYQAGDPVKHIAWKSYAKGQGLATKVYESVAQAERQQWLSWDDFSGIDTEGRLSRLCYCVLQAEREQLVYGLRLPNKTIALGNGHQHQQMILRELALFDDRSRGSKGRNDKGANDHG